MAHKPALKWYAFIIASLFFLFEFISRIEPSLAVTQISEHFGLSNAGFGTLSSLFFWVYAPMQLVVGLLLDRFGARRFILPAILICAGGVLLFASTSNVYIAGIGRLITGLGASFAFVGALYVVNHYFPAKQFALLSGAVNAIGMIGAAIGAVVLTPIIADTGWRPAFFATGGAGIVIFLLAVLFFRDTNSSSPTATKQPILAPLLGVLKQRNLWLIAIIGAFYYMPINIFGGLWGNSELIKDHALSPLQAETAVSMVFWGMAIGSILVGAISDHFGHRKWFIVGGAIFATIFFAAAIYGNSQSELLLSTLLFFGGFFIGGQMLVFAIAKEGQPIAVTGTVIAFINMLGIGGALFFQPLIGQIIDINNGSFTTAFSLIPACLLIAAMLSLYLKERKHSDHKEN